MCLHTYCTLQPIFHIWKLYFSKWWCISDSHKEKNHAVLVFSNLGISRSATVILAYLMHHNKFSLKVSHLSIESHFVGVHGPYELHRKEKQIECTALCDSVLIFTSFYNKVCRGIAYFNTKISYLSDFKSTKSKTLRTASTERITNWKSRRVIQCK